MLMDAYLAYMPLWTDRVRAPNSVRHAHGMSLPLCPPSSSMWTCKHPSLVPRRHRTVSTMRTSREQRVRVREEGRPERALLAGDRENLLRDGLWQAHGVWFPSVSETLPWRCLRWMHGAMW